MTVNTTKLRAYLIVQRDRADKAMQAAACDKAEAERALLQLNAIEGDWLNERGDLLAQLQRRRRDDPPPRMDGVQLQVLDTSPRKLDDTLMMGWADDIPVPMPVTIKFGEEL